MLYLIKEKKHDFKYKTVRYKPNLNTQSQGKIFKNLPFLYPNNGP